jgi:hypothetical protein
MNSTAMYFVVSNRINERLQEAERERLGRMASGDRSPRPPRGPLFAGVGRLVARFAHAV